MTTTSPSSSSSNTASVGTAYEFKTLKDLDAHLRREHELFLCDLCVENLKIFSKERKYYTRKDLVRHRKTGDPDDTSHRGHPLCKFCDVRYMDDEDLHRHLRKDHYYCHFCDPLGLHEFYDSYGNLRDHFRKEHFLCEEGSCREEKFTSVFRSDIDMQAHRAVNHCSSRMEAKEARILSLDFSLKPRSGGGGFAPQISASFQHQSALSSRRNPGGVSGQSSLMGAIGGQDLIESDDTQLLLPQELPRPEDFPTLTSDGSNGSAAVLAADSGLAVSGKMPSSSAPLSSYSELADKTKDSTVKIPPGVAGKKNKKQPQSFSSRITGGGNTMSGRLDEDFPALPGFSPSMLCPPVPTGLSVPSKKDLKNASKYATLSSVAAAVTSGVPKVVSKVATATCLPSSSSGMGPMMSCSTSNSKTLSTQSLLSASSSVAPTTSFPQVKDFSVQSVTDFPSLPVVQKKSKAGNKLAKASGGNSNPAFSGSNESFGPSATITTKSGKKLDFASKVASTKDKKSSSEVKASNSSAPLLQVLHGSKNNTSESETSDSRTRLKGDFASSATKESSSRPNKSVQLTNENEFPGLEPSLPTRISSSKNKDKGSAGQATAEKAVKRDTAGKNNKNPTNPGNKNISGASSGNNKNKSKDTASSSHPPSSSSSSSFSGQEKSNVVSGKKAPPPPSASSSSSNSMSNGHRFSSKSKGDTSSITLSSVAQVIMGSCGPSGSASAQNKANQRQQSHSQGNSRSLMDENGNSCNSETTNQRDLEANIVVNLEDSKQDTSGTSGGNNDFNHRNLSGGVNDRSSCHATGAGNTSNTNNTGSGNNTTRSQTDKETFVPPTNFEERNLSLVREVSEILQDHVKFSAFKKVSNDFRRGETRGDEYYKKCIELFGRSNFGKIFGELITLLPNVKKQNELLTAHEKSVKMSQGVKNSNASSSSGMTGNNGVWIINNTSFIEQGLLVCPTCQQVLARKDGPEHMSLHQRH